MRIGATWGLQSPIRKCLLCFACLMLMHSSGSTWMPSKPHSPPPQWSGTSSWRVPAYTVTRNEGFTIVLVLVVRQRQPSRVRTGITSETDISFAKNTPLTVERSVKTCIFGGKLYSQTSCTKRAWFYGRLQSAQLHVSWDSYVRKLGN